MKKKDGGYTLVELIIVLALMAVIISVIVINVSVASNAKSRECNSKIGSSITDLKITTLSKATSTGSVYMEIYQDATDNNYYAETTLNGVKTKQLLGSGNLTINCVYTNPSGGYSVSSSNKIYICFNRASGALVDISGNTSRLSEIYVKGHNHNYCTTLVPATGKILCEQVKSF